MQKLILVGYGNVGKELEKVLDENGIAVDLIVRSDNTDAYAENVDDESAVFISVPSKGDGSEMLHYYTDALERGACVITCEKAVLAHHWELVKKYQGNIRYSATVGGDSGILPAISGFSGEIQEIRAVVNGTLNYIAQELSKGTDEGEVFIDVIKKGFAEPGARDFEGLIQSELKDVAYKTVILASHSGLCEGLVPNDISIQSCREQSGYVVVIRKGKADVELISFDTNWFPKGENNALYINGEKIVEGPGAGGRATAERMFKDFTTR